MLNFGAFVYANDTVEPRYVCTCMDSPDGIHHMTAVGGSVRLKNYDTNDTIDWGSLYTCVYCGEWIWTDGMAHFPDSISDIGSYCERPDLVLVQMIDGAYAAYTTVSEESELPYCDKKYLDGYNFTSQVYNVNEFIE